MSIDIQPRILVQTSTAVPCSDSLNVPTGHGSGKALPASQYWPAGQTWFVIAPTLPSESWDMLNVVEVQRMTPTQGVYRDVRTRDEAETRQARS